MANRIKPVYKIPMSINKSRWDTPIALKSGSVGLSKPTTFKVLFIGSMAFVIWLFGFIYMTKHDFGIFYAILFTIGYIMLCLTSVKREPTGEMGYKTILPIYRYWRNHKDRFIQTRGSADIKEVDKLKFQIPVETIQEETGLIEYTNGDVGAMIEIIGNGSRALFVEEKEKIINAFEGFLQQLDLGVSVTIESKQSRQDCSIQIHNLENLKAKSSDPEINQILSQKIDILKHDIEKKFKSTHQYAYLRAPDEDRLNSVIQTLMRQQGEGLLRYSNPMTQEIQKDRLSEFFKLS